MNPSPTLDSDAPNRLGSRVFRNPSGHLPTAFAATGMAAALKNVVLWLLVGSLIWATSTVWVRSSWISGLVAPGVWIALGITGFLMQRGAAERLSAAAIRPLFALPLWGLLQLSLGWTVSQPATIDATLRWSLAAAVCICAYTTVSDRSAIERLLDVFVVFASALTILCVLQVDTSAGKVLWLFDTGYADHVFATFPYHNNYAQFVELALPVCLWRGLDRRDHRWAYLTIAGLMGASMLVSGSRAGLAVVVVEVTVLLALFVRRKQHGRVRTIFLFCILLGLAIAVSGSRRFVERLSPDDVWSLRPQLAAATWDLASRRPLTGWGLGTFPQVYPSVAVIDTGKYVNHAHTDWLEYLAEGGIPFAVALGSIFVLAAPSLWRSRWAIGVFGVCLHAVVDYPFARLAVAGWIFLLLALALAEDRLVKRKRATSAPTAKEGVCTGAMEAVHWAGRLLLSWRSAGCGGYQRGDG